MEVYLDAKVTQLQAADIIAYEVNKRAANYIGEAENFMRKSFDNLNLFELGLNH